jgi:hypothetical protein
MSNDKSKKINNALIKGKWREYMDISVLTAILTLALSGHEKIVIWKLDTLT